MCTDKCPCNNKIGSSSDNEKLLNLMFGIPTEVPKVTYRMKKYKELLKTHRRYF